MAAPKSKEETARRRAEVLEFMESIGPFSIPAAVIAKKHGVTVKMIYNDRDFWVKKIDFNKIDLEGKKLIMSLMKNLSITEELKAKGTPAERIKAIQASNQTTEVLTKIMENYGFKEKIADKMEHLGNAPVTINLIEKSVEEIKLGKSNNKSKTGPNS